MNELRAYFFNNQYLAGIHNGIQAGHALDAMWSFYTDKFFLEIANGPVFPLDAQFDMLTKFSRNHKTWVILNAGDHAALEDLFTFFAKPQNPSYPFSQFQEPGLNNANTSVAIILPERMYDDVANAFGKTLLENYSDPYCGLPTFTLDEVLTRNYTAWERELLKRKAACSKAV
jgi:hypothetical protein